MNVDTRENPFAVERVESLPFRFPKQVTWESLLARLAQQNYCAAIVGPNGSGKTMLLEQFIPKLEALGFTPQLFRITNESGMREKERLPEMLRRVTKPGFILLDGAEQLSTRQWLPVRAAASQAAGFIVTVHRVSRLPAILECDATVPLLEDIIHELTGAWLPVGEAESLLQRHHGNVRHILRELGERWEGA